MEVKMFRTKRDRQLELFDQTPIVSVRMPMKTILKITSLLADLLAGLWLSPETSGEEPHQFQGGQGE
jgi:hypothetical protein